MLFLCCLLTWPYFSYYLQGMKGLYWYCPNSVISFADKSCVSMGECVCNGSWSTFMLTIDVSFFIFIQNSVQFSAVLLAFFVFWTCDFECYLYQIYRVSLNFQDCTHARHLAAGTSNAVRLSRFFDKVSSTCSMFL